MGAEVIEVEVAGQGDLAWHAEFLSAYREILGREAGEGPIEPKKLVVPMLERFIVTDRGFAKARRSLPKREVAKQGP